MSKPNPLRIAFIGFGEVGQRFSRDFKSKPGVTLAAFDRLAGSTLGVRLETSARDIGVDWSTSAAAACRQARVVISAVTADQAVSVAEAAADFLQPGQIFLDINSASPSAKRRAAKAVERAGASYVEGAVMGPVRKPGIEVPILGGGPDAIRAADLLNGLGMKITPVASEYGKASAIKLCRSIMIKGIEALIVDCARASKHWDVEHPVYASLAATFPGTDWKALATDMAERVATHGIRRSAEMYEAAEMLAEMSVNPELARAVAAAQQRGAKPKA